MTRFKTLTAAALATLTLAAAPAFAQSVPGSDITFRDQNTHSRLVTAADRTYGAPNGAVDTLADAHQPVPQDVMVPGSDASRSLYNAQIRRVVAGSTGQGFVASEHQQSAHSGVWGPGSGAVF